MAKENREGVLEKRSLGEILEGTSVKNKKKLLKEIKKKLEKFPNKLESISMKRLEILPKEFFNKFME